MEQKIIALIRHGKEYMPVNSNYEITRENSKQFSGEWKLIGAVRFNNFGHKVEEKGKSSLAAITNWFYKNGKQKWYVIDYDHGSFRVWMSPRHSIVWNG